MKPLESEALYRRLIDHAPLGVLSADREGQIQTVNHRLLEMLGSPSEEETRAINLLTFPPLIEAGIASLARQCLETGEDGVGDLPYVSKWGKRVQYRFRFAALPGPDGEIAGLHGLVEDVTEQRRAEAELRWRSEFERLLISLATDFLHLPAPQIDDGIDRALAAVREFTGDDICYVIERSDDGSLRQLTHEALAPETSSLEDALGSRGFDDLPEAANAFERGEIVHVPDVASNSDFDAYRLHPSHRTAMRSIVGLPLLLEGKLGAVLGFASVRERKRWSSDSIALLRVLGEIIENALGRRRHEAEREALQTQLRQAQKLEAVGTLAGGIAHDFNNLLAAIIGHTELALLRLPEGSELRPDLAEVQRAGERARQLVDRILTFSRREERQPRPIDIVPLVGEVLDLIRAALPSTIEFDVALPNLPIIVRADPTEIHQMVMNIATNAGQAMPEGGVLGLSLEVVDLAMEERVGRLPRRAGCYADLCIRDTGAGLDSETAQRIFDPYFTTKEVGQGTGLGLSIVHGIVSALGGEVRVESKLGQGAEFHVYLPVSTETPDMGSVPTGIVAGSGERILFVDDEPAIQRWGLRALEGLGYHVRVCGDGEEALECLRAETFDVVVTDQTMPVRTGIELVRELRPLRPDLPVVLLTGLLDSDTVAEAKEAGVNELLAKPLSLADLARTLHAVLGKE
ncbi:MAG: response regulator [bacterium]|nr:response regulator [bacterium]